MFLAYYVDTNVKAPRGVLSHSKPVCMDFWCLQIPSPSLSLVPSPHYYFRPIMLILGLKWSVLSENYFLFYAFLSWQINHRLLVSVGMSIFNRANYFLAQKDLKCKLILAAVWRIKHTLPCITAWMQMRSMLSIKFIIVRFTTYLTFNMCSKSLSLLNFACVSNKRCLLMWRLACRKALTHVVSFMIENDSEKKLSHLQLSMSLCVRIHAESMLWHYTTLPVTSSSSKWTGNVRLPGCPGDGVLDFTLAPLWVGHLWFWGKLAQQTLTGRLVQHLHRTAVKRRSWAGRQMSVSTFACSHELWIETDSWAGNIMNMSRIRPIVSSSLLFYNVSAITSGSRSGYCLIDYDSDSV